MAAAWSNTRRKKAARAASLGYRVAGRDMSSAITRSTSKPLSMVMTRAKLAISSPAVTSSVALRPTSRLTRRLRMRRPPRPSVLVRLPDFKLS